PPKKANISVDILKMMSCIGVSQLIALPKPAIATIKYEALDSPPPINSVTAKRFLISRRGRYQLDSINNSPPITNPIAHAHNGMTVAKLTYILLSLVLSELNTQ